MKKRRSLQFVLMTALLSMAQSYAQSEWTHPGSWTQLVSSSKNPTLEKDTVVLQDFDGSKYQVNYSVEGKYDYFYPKEEGIFNSSDSKAIRLYPGSVLTFDEYEFDAYNSVQLNVPYAIQHVNKGENIVFTVHRSGDDDIIDNINWQIPSDDYSLGFAETTSISGKDKHSFWTAKNYPYDLTIQITENASTPSDEGCYCLDRVYLSAKNIPTYSLFNGPGIWHLHELWSHNCPTRNRKALVQGEVILDEKAICKEIITCNANIQLIDEGCLQTSQMTVILPFPDKGKWYFVSFPFDVYPENVDSNFQLGDETTQTTAQTNNIFYVQTYDGIRRSTQNTASGNWKVVSQDEIDNDIPLFYKGKGYLVALDETAETDTLCFVSPANETLVLTSSMQIPVQADEAQKGDSGNNGWYLCGNPYPSSLSLRDIQSNSALDGNIYCYEEGEYKAYPIGSNHVLAPYAAFFVKAKRDTELQIQKTLLEESSTFRSALQRYSGEHSDPTLTALETISPKTYYQIYDKQIHFRNLPQAGSLSLFNMQGKLLGKETLPSGDSQYTLPTQSGVYLLRIQAGDWQETLKIKN